MKSQIKKCRISFISGSILFATYSPIVDISTGSKIHSSRKVTFFYQKVLILFLFHQKKKKKKKKKNWGWLGEAKVSCILCHWCIQLILASSWARPAILALDKGRGGMFLFFLFLHFHSFFFLPCPSLSSPVFSLSLRDDAK